MAESPGTGAEKHIIKNISNLFMALTKMIYSNLKSKAELSILGL